MNHVDKQTKVEKRGFLKGRAVSVLTLILVIAITAALFILFRYNPERIKEFENYGYPGAFLIGLVSNATVILPTPGLILLIAIASVSNPVLVGLFGAIGGCIGEMTGYMLGRGGRGFAQKNRMVLRAEAWMKRRGFITVFLFSLLPFLPIDIAGVVAGTLRFTVWKFLLACFLGKTILYIVITQTSSWGWEALLPYIS
jgi:uncharacterized membrane protein YdjX (TVP38/TMEM64 family)